MKLSNNKFKTALNGGQPQIGLWCALADGYSIEISACAGFDWLLIDSEHSPNNLNSILHQLQTLAAYPVEPVVRPLNGSSDTLKQLLDIGARTLLIPMIESEEQARQVVAATRYAPTGHRGVGAGLARASRWGRVEDYIETCTQQLCILLQIETRAGLEALEAIASVDGVDGVFIGAADLAADMGYPGNVNHPKVQQAVLRAFERLQALDKPAGALSTHEEQSRRCLSAGCQFVAVGADTSLLASAVDGLARRFKSDNIASTQTLIDY